MFGLKSASLFGETKKLEREIDEFVNIVSEVMKGKGGGGRRDMALAGGSDIEMVDEAKKILIKKIKNKR